MSNENLIASVERIETKILLLRGQKVMLSMHLAELYEVEPRILVQAVKRNIERFPEDFMFQLNPEEFANLKSQFGISSWGGVRTAPYAFTEQGVSMLSSVLRSSRAFKSISRSSAPSCNCGRCWLPMPSCHKIGRAGKEIRHQISSGFRCHPRTDDSAGNQEKTPHRIRAVGEKNDVRAWLKGINTVIISAFIPRYGAQYGHSSSYQPGQRYGGSLSVRRA